MTHLTEDIITPEAAQTLSGLFDERVRRTPDSTAYKYFDEKTNSWEVCSWSEMASEISRWRTAMSREGLSSGDRVAIWICNCKEWVIMDQAALGLGLVVVPLFCNDRAENVAYILKDAGVKFLLIDNEDYWVSLDSVPDKPGGLELIVSMNRFTEDDNKDTVRFVDEWLPDKGNDIDLPPVKSDDLATIVYTSGTTGRPKGVKLSHHNILWNSFGGLNRVTVYREDIFLSFLPLSHTFERTVGYYIPVMAGAAVAYNRSIHRLVEDFKAVGPTLLVSVPRIFERVYAKIMEELEERHTVIERLFEWAVELGWKRFEYEQGREEWGLSFLLWPFADMLFAKKIRDGFGGCIRAIVTGGAPLSIDVAKVFLAAGVPLLQGYGMTESGPVISVNMINDNIPSSVGTPYEDAEVRIGRDDELLVRSPGVMLGYLNNPEATSEVIDSEGWLHTGDKVRIENGHIFITGRIKEIIVMANGEKVSPHDIEMVIDMDPFIEQVMIVGEGKPYLSALVVLNRDKEDDIASKFGLKPDDPGFLKNKRIEQLIIDRIASRLHSFPGYAKVRRAALIGEPWTVDNELITPTLKLRRKRIIELYSTEIHELYEGHEVGTE
jgi:long-chain acyl-CoA synthetase